MKRERVGKPPLREHQKTALDWICSVGRGLLGDEPGLGKSRVAIEAFDGKRVLVVAPGMVINGGTWRDEIERWADHPEGFTVAPYSMLNKREKNSPNFGTKKHPKFYLRPEYEGHWDALVVDEAHYTKGRKTSWTWAVQEIAKNSDQVLLMTGTPIPNWGYELFTLLRVIWPEDAMRGGSLGSYWRWVGKWFEVYDSYYNDKAKEIGGLRDCESGCKERPAHDPCEHYATFVEANLGEKFLRRLRDDVLTDLPPATRQVVETPMSTNQAKLYRQMKKEYIAQVSDAEVVAWSDGSKNVWLDRITTSDWFLEPEGVPHGGKFEQLRFDLEGRSRPTLVVAHYRDSVEAAARVAEAAGARTAFVHGGLSSRVAGERVQAFKRGELDCLVGSLDLISEGLTLTVADMIIFLEMSWRPSRNEQAARRVHRMGQKRPVTIREYVTPNSVDSRKRTVLEGKVDHQVRMMSAHKFAELL